MGIKRIVRKGAGKKAAAPKKAAKKKAAKKKQSLDNFGPFKRKGFGMRPKPMDKA